MRQQRRPLSVAALCLAAGLAAAGLSAQAGGGGAIDVVDQMGRRVRLERAPQRIVSIAPANTELLFALGLGSRVVGVTDYCNWPPEATRKPRVGSYSTPDIEKVASLAPDLVVAERLHYHQVIPALERVGLKVIGLDPLSVDDVLAAVELLGRAAGAEAAARTLKDGLQARLERVGARLAGQGAAADRPAVFYLIWHDPLFTAGGDTLQGELIERAGGRNVFARLDGYPQVSLEAVLAARPELILVGAGHEELGESPVLSWALRDPRLKGTPAARAGRILPIEADLVSRGGPRVVDALERLLGLIHPGLAER